MDFILAKSMVLMPHFRRVTMVLWLWRRMPLFLGDTRSYLGTYLGMKSPDVCDKLSDGSANKRIRSRVLRCTRAPMHIEKEKADVTKRVYTSYYYCNFSVGLKFFQVKKLRGEGASCRGWGASQWSGTVEHGGLWWLFPSVTSHDTASVRAIGNCLFWRRGQPSCFPTGSSIWLVVHSPLAHLAVSPPTKHFWD